LQNRSDSLPLKYCGGYSGMKQRAWDCGRRRLKHSRIAWGVDVNEGVTMNQELSRCNRIIGLRYWEAEQ